MSRLILINSPFKYSPLAIPVSSFVTGIVLAWLFEDWIVMVSLFSVVFALGLFLNRNTPAVISGFAMGGILCVAVHTCNSVDLSDVQDNTALTADIYAVGFYREGAVLDVGVTGITPETDSLRTYPLSGVKLKSYVRGDVHELVPGTTVLIRNWTKLGYGEPALPGEREQETEKIFVSATDVTAVGEFSPVRRFFYLQRENLINHILWCRLKPATAHFLIAVIAGDSDFISAPQRDEFAAAGIAHILALSGAHVAIIAVVLSVIFIPLRLLGIRNAVIFLTIALCWYYALLTGFSYSVVRAVIMLTVIGAARVMSRTPSGFNNLFLAALIILVISPDALRSLSFQLSFSAAAGIIAVIPVIRNIKIRNSILRYSVTIIVVSTGAVLATAPVMLATIHRFTPYFLLAAVPSQFLITAIMISGCIVMFLTYSGIPCGVFRGITDIMYDFLERITHTVSGFPGAIIETPETGIVPSLLLGIAITALLCTLYSDRKKLPASVSAAAFAGFLALYLLPADDTPPGGGYRVINERGTTFVIDFTTDTLMIASTEQDSLERDFLMNGFLNLHQKFIRYGKFADVRFIHDWDGTVTIGDSVDIFLTDSLRPAVKGNIRNLYICKGYTGAVVGDYRYYSPDSVILSPVINKTRRKRYISELKEFWREEEKSQGDTCAPSRVM